MVTLGLGVSLAAITSALPFITVLGANKTWIFILSGSILLFAQYLNYRSGKYCPTEPELAALCARARRRNRFIIGLSAAIWFVGFTVAYFALPLRVWLDN